MTKSLTSITIDSDLLHLVKQRYPGKLSGLINEFLKDLIMNNENKPKEQLEQEFKEIEKTKQEINSRALALKQQIDDLNKKAVKKKERQEKLNKEQEKQKENEKELEKPLSFEEILFFKELVPRSTDFDTNYYNNTFFKQFSEKQYLERYKKYTDELKKK